MLGCELVNNVPTTLVNVPVAPDTLPVLTLPVTVKSTSVPTVVKLEKITPDASVLPVKLAAGTDVALTPVNALPLPIK